MFEGLKNWLLKEEETPEEIIDENEIEELKEEIQKEPEIVVEEVKEEPVKVVKDEKRINKITLDAEPVKPKTKVVSRPSRPTVKKEEFVIPKVISPYYGLKDEEEVVESTNTTSSVVNTPKEVVKEQFNEVISPFYGRNLKKTIKEEPKKNNEIKEEIKEEDEGESLSLDEIVSQSNENEDDLIQFSLFGEEKKIKDETFENEEADNTDDLPF